MDLYTSVTFQSPAGCTHLESFCLLKQVRKQGPRDIGVTHSRPHSMSGPQWAFTKHQSSAATPDASPEYNDAAFKGTEQQACVALALASHPG